MKTEKLYYADPFLTDFTATVLDCQPDKNGYLVTLDRTAFYPEGGGQPADHGTLGAVQVTDVHETKGVIFHTCDGPVEIGTQVAGAVDWPRRFDHMQQHSGEHILSGLLCSLYHCDNVGFHLGADTVTIDYNAELTWEQVMAAEKAANEVIWQDTPVDITFPAPDALARLNYRSKKALTGQVRIVAFPGADCCACCGTHVERTGQIGQIKVMGAMNYKGGTRITLACGGRALTAFSQMLEEQAKLRAQFSAKNGQLAAAAQRQADELAAQKARAAQLEQQVFAYTAAQVQEGDQPVLFVRDLSGDSLRRLCLALSEHTHRPCAVFTQGGQGYAYCLAWNGGDARVLAKAMNAALNGRGGGKPELCSGSVAETDLDKVTAFFQEQEQAGNI
mgnify:CR=1 FL=1